MKHVWGTPWGPGAPVSGIPKTQNANSSLLICRGWRVCSYDLSAWEKARRLDSPGGVLSGERLQISSSGDVRKLVASWCFVVVF